MLTEGDRQYLDCRDFPYRGTAWRWGWAEAVILGEEQHSQRYEDSYTTRATQYLRALQDCSTSSQYAELAEKMPEIHVAYEIDRNGELGLELQARILARHNTKELLKMFDMDLVTLETYESLFFDIRDRIDVHDFVVGDVICEHGGNGHIELVKSLGYCGGPKALDIALPYLLKHSQSVRDSVFSDEMAIIMIQRVRLFEKILKASSLDIQTTIEIMQKLANFDTRTNLYVIAEINDILFAIDPKYIALNPRFVPHRHTHAMGVEKLSLRNQLAEAIEAIKGKYDTDETPLLWPEELPYKAPSTYRN